MPGLLTILSLCVQAFFFWHYFKRSCCSDRWMFYVLLIPGLGPLFYFIAVYLPSELTATEKQRLQTSALNLIAPERNYKSIKLAYDRAPTVPNKHALARALINKGDGLEAAKLLREIIATPLGLDVPTLLDLAEAEALQDNFGAAQAALDRAYGLTDSGNKRDQIDLSAARLYEAQNKPDDAERHYRQIIDSYPGEEVRCRLAQLLLRAGRYRESWELLDQVLQRLRTGTTAYRKHNKDWDKIARQLMQQLEQKAGQNAARA